MLYAHTVEFHLAVKIRKLMIISEKTMELKIIM